MADNLSSTTPAAPGSKQNIVVQADAVPADSTVDRNFSFYDPTFVGDAGSGGKEGNVPAPAAGDAAAGKYLKADGSWQVPSGGSGGGGLAADASVVRGKPYSLYTWSTSAGWNLFTIYELIPGQRVIQPCTAFKIVCHVPAQPGASITMKMVIKRTLKGSTAVIDTTAVTFGGSATPVIATSTTLPTKFTSDQITLTWDADHDYYIFTYFSAGNPTLYVSGTNPEQNGDLWSNDQSGDHTGDATIGVTSFATGSSWLTEQIIATAASGGVSTPSAAIVNANSNYTAHAGDVVLCDSSLGGFTVTLPDASVNTLKLITIKKTSSDGNAVTVARTGTNTIDGQTSWAITVSKASMQVISDGTNWEII